MLFIGNCHARILNKKVSKDLFIPAQQQVGQSLTDQTCSVNGKKVMLAGKV